MPVTTIFYIIILILVALFFVLGLKKIIRILEKASEEEKTAARLKSKEKKQLEEGMEEKLEHVLSGADKPGGKLKQLRNFARKNPKLFAQYLKGWKNKS